MTDLTAVIAERTAQLDALLTAAVRVEVALYLSRHIEGRVVNRPGWLARTPRIMYETMRLRTDQRAAELVPDLVARIAEVRAALGLGGGVAADELEPVTQAIGPVLAAATRSLLLKFFVPGDDYVDRPGDNVDLKPRFDLTYEPTIGLRWAFTQVRMMDVARLRWERHRHGPLAPSFEVRMFLPEALVDDLSDY
jgi:hypothetical protein